MECWLMNYVSCQIKNVLCLVWLGSIKQQKIFLLWTCTVQPRCAISITIKLFIVQFMEMNLSKWQKRCLIQKLCRICRRIHSHFLIQIPYHLIKNKIKTLNQMVNTCLNILQKVVFTTTFVTPSQTGYSKTTT